MVDDKYTLEDFDFDLPPELIARYPVPERDQSRLFILDRTNGSNSHARFHQICDYLKEGDVLVLNQARVISAKIICKRKTGGNVEIVLTKQLDNTKWEAISNRTARLKPGDILTAVSNADMVLQIVGRFENHLEVMSNIILTEDILRSIAHIALPPYLNRDADDTDTVRYQTVYAKKSGSVAAPTAGLHFTDELIDRIVLTGARMAFLTLDVSWGTFQPVRSKFISAHRMHTERYELPDETAAAVNDARQQGNRVISVGTTSLRVLESTFRGGINIPGSGETDIFIYPPRKVESVDSLITNFHTPSSTLLMLVSAFAGYDRIMTAYREAVELKYRFFSYGDAMLIL
jgi:S-adenosylmethionine:tRNA ribosyltransferase-isomerase